MRGSTIIVTTVPVIKAMFFAEMFFFHLPYNPFHRALAICLLTFSRASLAQPMFTKTPYLKFVRELIGEMVKKPEKWQRFWEVATCSEKYVSQNGNFPKISPKNLGFIQDCWAPPSNRRMAPTPLGTDYCWWQCHQLPCPHEASQSELLCSW